MSGRFDVALGGMADHAERRRWSISPNPTSTGRRHRMVRRPARRAAARHGAIAVQSGTMHEAYLRDEGLDYRAYSTEPEALAALAAGGRSGAWPLR
jgi:ABC-type amino acid transport substrate-binding protein